MKTERMLILLFPLMVLLFQPTFGQKKTGDVAVYQEKVIWGAKKTVLTFEPIDLSAPDKPDDFKPVFHFPPIRQDTTGSCWCFAGISFLESECFRLRQERFKLSEMFVVYWTFVEKARRFIREKGNSLVSQGSQQQSVIECAKKYGLVRAEDYAGLLPGKLKHNHDPLEKEIKSFLNYLKENAAWDEASGIDYVKALLNRHLGKPPETIVLAGQTMTPKAFTDRVLQLPLEDYVQIMSFKKIPFYSRGKYDVADNWWQDSTYYNVPLSDFYAGLKSAVQHGFSTAIAGDVSEPGKLREKDIFIVPSFDIAQNGIDQDAREFRFDNSSSSDDHCLHLLGHQPLKGRDWFLIKDSGASAYEGQVKGYYFMRDDFLRLKMLTYLIHKDAVREILTKFN